MRLFESSVACMERLLYTVRCENKFSLFLGHLPFQRTAGKSEMVENDLRGKENLFKQPKDSNQKTRMKENREEIVDLKRLYMHFCKKINKKN